jgi:quinol monooxygenase YgiN
MAEILSLLSFPAMAPNPARAYRDGMNDTHTDRLVNVGILARIVAKPDKAEEVAAFLAGAQPLAAAEPATTVWFAIRLGPQEFAIFDAFADDAGRQAHLRGPIAAALLARADELLAEPPRIDGVDILAAKL